MCRQAGGSGVFPENSRFCAVRGHGIPAKSPDLALGTNVINGASAVRSDDQTLVDMRGLCGRHNELYCPGCGKEVDVLLVREGDPLPRCSNCMKKTGQRTEHKPGRNAKPLPAQGRLL